MEKWAVKFNLRVLCPDRPGYGESLPLPGAGLKEFIAGLEQALTLKQIERFFLVGVSGGNPAALSAAAYFGNRVLALGSICGLAPFTEARDFYPPYARRGFDLAKRTPEALLRMITQQYVKNIRPESQLKTLIPRLTPPDQKVLQDPETLAALMESMVLARKQGSAGIVFDLKSYVNPWPCQLDKITCPYYLWHGQLDVVLPYAMSTYVHGQVPHSKLKLFPDEGHYSLPIMRGEEILSDLISRAEGS